MYKYSATHILSGSSTFRSIPMRMNCCSFRFQYQHTNAVIIVAHGGIVILTQQAHWPILTNVDIHRKSGWRQRRSECKKCININYDPICQYCTVSHTITTLQPIFHQMHFIINYYVSFIDHVFCIASTFNVHKRALHIFWFSFTQNGAFHVHTPGCVYYPMTFEMSKVLDRYWKPILQNAETTSQMKIEFSSPYDKCLSSVLNISKVIRQ